MNRDQKAAAIAEIADQIEESSAIFAVDYRGISVPEAAELRSKLREADATFKVVKNSLTERAADQAGAETLKPFLAGPTALTFVRGDVAVAAKAIADYARATQLLPFKGGLMDGAELDAEQIRAISRLPSREALYGQLVGVVASPGQRARALARRARRRSRGRARPGARQEGVRRDPRRRAAGARRPQASRRGAGGRGAGAPRGAAGRRRRRPQAGATAEAEPARGAAPRTPSPPRSSADEPTRGRGRAGRGARRRGARAQRRARAEARGRGAAATAQQRGRGRTAPAARRSSRGRGPAAR